MLSIPDLRDRQRDFGDLCKIAAEWPPCRRYVDLAMLDRLDQPRRRVGLTIVAIDYITANIVDDSLLTKHLRGRRILTVIAYEMHADRQMVQARIEQGV